MTSWLPIPENSDFTLANLPFGIFSTPTTPPRPCTRLGNHILSLPALSPLLPLPAHLSTVLETPTLNAFAALGNTTVNSVRTRLQHLLLASTPDLRDNPDLRAAAVFELSAAITLHVPFTIGDYTDFYAGRNHAHRVGTLFRGADNALNPNYESLPIGYHGRASSIVISGTPVRRPHGQILNAENKPVHAPTEKLDFELELAAFIGTGNDLGEPVTMEQAGEKIFGFVLMNDWSARDVQRWEYVPLGPFTAKSFATTISAWVVVPAALERFRVPPLQRWSQEPLCAYLDGGAGYRGVFAGTLEVEVDGERVCRCDAGQLVWGWEQMVVQQTVGGCNLRTGDLLGSGTVSGKEEGERGCLLEAGKPFLKDGQEVVMRGWCGEGENRVGWGECRGKILPAKERK